MQVQGAHHSLGDAYAAGIVALIKHTEVLPKQIPVSQLENSTAKVLVRADSRLTDVANEILG